MYPVRAQARKAVHFGLMYILDEPWLLCVLFLEAATKRGQNKVEFQQGCRLKNLYVWCKLCVEVFFHVFEGGLWKIYAVFR